MTRAFDYCAKIVLGHEGGEVNDRRDPGGHTNLGVTQATLDGARKMIPGLPATVDLLSRAHALSIYEALYWRPIRGDDLPLGLALMVFDCAINQGTGRAAKFLQLAVGTNTDGAIGPKTIAAVNARPLASTINEFGARRMLAYMQLDSLQDRFGLGWSRRLMSVHAAAITAPAAA